MKKEMPLWLAVIILVVFVGVAFWGRIHESKKKMFHDGDITTFEECARLYPVMESYPERCMTPSGKSFTKVYPDTPVNN